MLKSSIKIARPIDVVWDYFTEITNWSKWYGGGLKEILPDWQNGATLIWSSGGSSTIKKIVSKQEIGISGAWMDTSYMFYASGDSATTIEVIEFEPKGGAGFNDGGVAHKAELQKTLQNLKISVESETAFSRQFLYASSAGDTSNVVNRNGLTALTCYAASCAGMLIAWYLYSPAIIAYMGGSVDDASQHHFVIYQLLFLIAISPLINGVLRSILFTIGRASADSHFMPIIALLVYAISGLGFFSSKRSQEGSIFVIILTGTFFFIDTIVALLFLLRITKKETIITDK
ncbi:MAG: hypothetical protein A2511_04305 [Deltaproteobacteria bacterium RIFOXYD12_FULL_50_9]|nr:MAG: hypothetical protein A2511_04305 [Deltaproteobacteria bacterium RIFOXYD12_FULL_50_9]